ncbi:glycosyltransferase family 2 protein [Pedobacter sp. N23S346]|uniref:glycosyltransferase family 2 protein n=1 Tax=Pedobacter sp. N23S346 TaxID=3402750 RepID=UPI003ACE4C7F
MVSVIIPAFNAEKTIEETLNSIFKQSFKDFEIIVVNDGSTDQTLKVLNLFKSKVKIINTPNMGVSYARENGLKYAVGNFIQFLDADDILSPNKFNIQRKALIDNNADIAYGDWQKFHTIKDQIIILETVRKKLENDLERSLFTDFWCPPAAIMYSKKIADQLIWKKNLPIIQDARYLLDAAIIGGKFIYTPGVMALYRDNQSDSLSKISELKFVSDCLTNAIEIYNIWLGQNKFTIERQQAVIGVLRYCINRLTIYDRNLAEKAINFLLRIDSKYIPFEKGYLRYISKVFGYKNAERLAGLKRRLIK